MQYAQNSCVVDSTINNKAFSYVAKVSEADREHDFGWALYANYKSPLPTPRFLRTSRDLTKSFQSGKSTKRRAAIWGFCSLLWRRRRRRLRRDCLACVRITRQRRAPIRIEIDRRHSGYWLRGAGGGKEGAAISTKCVNRTDNTTKFFFYNVWSIG